MGKQYQQAKKDLKDLLKRGVNPNDALQAIASKLANTSGYEYHEAKQMLAFEFFGIVSY